MNRPACLVILALALPGCATQSTTPDTDAGSRIGGAVTAPLVDLNLLRTKIPKVLIEARDHPYRQPVDAGCEPLLVEVAELDTALGPDLDVRESADDQGMLAKGGTLAGDSAIDALRGTAQDVIPFRSWVRKLTGAEKHSREVASAIAAGIVRRAYLKGLGESRGCQAPAAPLPPATPDQQDTPGPVKPPQEAED